MSANPEGECCGTAVSCHACIVQISMASQCCHALKFRLQKKVWKKIESSENKDTIIVGLVLGGILFFPVAIPVFGVFFICCAAKDGIDYCRKKGK